jgi:hypothetical protein
LHAEVNVIVRDSMDAGSGADILAGRWIVDLSSLPGAASED